MYVEFKTLRFKNILSYGNMETELDFEKGLNIIKAPNGSGKSTILDALTFVLFGKPYRNIKLNELINRTNKKALEVSIDFKIGKDNYTIKRGLKPTLFEIYRNNEPLDLLSSKKLNQDEIDKLLGINLRLFKNIVGIAVTNNLPFLSMSIGDKRALVENIFNIDVLGLMCKDVKKQRSILQAEIELKNIEKRGITNSITDNERYLENMKNYIATFNESRDATVTRISDNIKECEKRILLAENNMKIAEDKITELKTDIGEQPDISVGRKLDADISVARSTISRLSSTLERLQKYPTCPICNSPLTEGHAKKHIEEMNNELETVEKQQLPELQKKLEEFTKATEAYNKTADFIKVIRDKARTEEIVKENMTNQLDNYKSQLETEKNKVCPAEVDTYVEKLEELNKQLTTIDETLTSVEENLAITTELIGILGDDGIKAYFFKKLTAILNKNVNEYLTKFELPIQITFDDQMQETITENMMPTSYDSYSGGERCRIDMSILLSFFNVSRIISNWSCNLLYIDELLDNGIDKSGIDQFISTLYNIVSDNKKKLGIYIVSHKLNEINVQVTSTVEIKKRTGFSSLEITK